MEKVLSRKVSDFLFLFSVVFIIYMPLHVFIAQSASLLTGGIEVWKAVKDVILFLLIPFLLYVSYRRGLWRDKTFRWLLVLGTGYFLLHGLYLLFDTSDHTYSTLVASVYNTRLLGYLLLGYLVGTGKNSRKYLKYLLTATVVIATLVAAFGVAQYLLPKDMLEHIGYSVDRGVKPMFFIDDRTDLPRVMSTLKDPNSLGAYLILPLLLCGVAVINKQAREELFIRRFRRRTLLIMTVLQAAALFLTFSRGALLALALSTVALLCIVTGNRIVIFLRKYGFVAIGALVLLSAGLYAVRDHPFIQDYVFHAAVSSDDQDPNEKRLSLQGDAIEEIIDEPEGHGPGSAGLVAITNPKGGILTENYYLQIGYEVGWLGLVLFVAILYIVTVELAGVLRRRASGEQVNALFAAVLLASLAGYLFQSLLIHLWSNEAVALQWWLLAGCAIGTQFATKMTTKHR